MNDEHLEQLENDLRKCRPAPLSATFLHGLSHMPARPSAFADRVLAIWTSLGAVAACAILFLTIHQFATASVSAPPTSQEVAQRQQVILEYQAIIASR